MTFVFLYPMTMMADDGAIAVDLSLPSGTKWADRNVGASKPEDYGGYYAWGETEEKEVYNWSTYIHCDGSEETCRDIGADIAGTQNDVAHVKWGGSWKMPTSDQMQELLDNCTSEWTTVNGVKGYKFTGPNGNSIFLPAAGDRWDGEFSLAGHKGSYHSSTFSGNYTGLALGLCFYSAETQFCFNNRDNGKTVRPVTITDNSPNLTLAGSSGFGSPTLTKSSEYTYTAKIKNEGSTTWNGSFYLKNGDDVLLAWYDVSISAGGTKTLYKTYTPNETGTQTLTLYYQTGGTGSGEVLPAGSYSNPITVTVTDGSTIDEGVWRKTIIVKTLDGATMEYLIDKDTKVRIVGRNLTIETEGMDLSYELESMSQIRYGKKLIPDAVHDIPIHNDRPYVWNNNNLYFSGLRENTLINIYSFDGKLIHSERFSGEAHVSFGNLPSGVYIVKMNNETYKILKK